MTEDKETYLDKKLRPLPRWIFMSRWLQAPLYWPHCCSGCLCLAVLDRALSPH